MTIRLVDAGWGKELTDALRADAGELRIICPFIKVGALDRLLSHRPGGPARRLQHRRLARPRRRAYLIRALLQWLCTTPRESLIRFSPCPVGEGADIRLARVRLSETVLGGSGVLTLMSAFGGKADFDFERLDVCF